MSWMRPFLGPKRCSSWSKREIDPIPSDLIGMSVYAFHKSIEKKKVNPKEERILLNPHNFKSFCLIVWEYKSSKNHWNRYKVDRRDKSAESMRRLTLVNTIFINDWDFQNYLSIIQSHEYHGHILGKFEKPAKLIVVQMKWAVFTSLDSVLAISIIQNFIAVVHSNKMYEGATMWLFRHFIEDSIKDALVHRLWASEGYDHQKKYNLPDAVKCSATF